MAQRSEGLYPLDIQGIEEDRELSVHRRREQRELLAESSHHVIDGLGALLHNDGDSLDALVSAYLEGSMYSSVRYEGNEPKSEQLLHSVREVRASGVLLMSPSFCDPALLDRPHFQRSLDEAGVPYTSLKYAENLGQFQTIREQTGTFAEAIQLWGDAE